MVKKIIPVSKNSFKVKKDETFVPIAGLESFEFTFDGEIQTYFDFSLEGFQRALKTGLAMSLSSDIKRVYGDDGNDLLASTMFLIGEDCTKEFEWTMADGKTVSLFMVINIESIGGSTNDIETMSVSFTVDGKPEIKEVEVGD